MSNCVYCKKQILTKFIFSLLDLKSKEIQMALNISKSVVSRYLTGERGCPEIDLYIIEKIFGIKVKDYTINEWNQASKIKYSGLDFNSRSV